MKKNKPIGSVIVNQPTEKGTIGYIDIPSPGFFWLLYPWKEGKLATIDGKGRFAEISFVGESGIRITPLVDFPQHRRGLDRLLRVAPEANIFVTKSGERFFVADVAAKKTKSLVPRVGWRFKVGVPVFLDPKNGIINFKYYASADYKKRPGSQPFYNVIYDAKNDRVLYKSPDAGDPFVLFYPLTPEWAMADIPNDDGIPGTKTILYNWKTHETAENELTKKLITPGLQSIWHPGENHNLEGRYLFADIPIPGRLICKKVKVTWDENYENVTVIPLDYLMPPEAEFWYDFYLSADGKWATNFFGGYRGLYGELLDRRVFFHLDARYPNGISMPIFIDGYHKNSWNYGSFVEHPAYGLCYAEEMWLGGKEYLRLYKMDDVLSAIAINQKQQSQQE
jgi:hypothetical protein